jgi:hypothetical protein
MFPLAGSGPAATEARPEKEPIHASSRTTPLPWAQGKLGRRSIQPECQRHRAAAQGLCSRSNRIRDRTRIGRCRLMPPCDCRSNSCLSDPSPGWTSNGRRRRTNFPNASDTSCSYRPRPWRARPQPSDLAARTGSSPSASCRHPFPLHSGMIRHLPRQNRKIMVAHQRPEHECRVSGGALLARTHEAVINP